MNDETHKFNHRHRNNNHNRNSNHNNKMMNHMIAKLVAATIQHQQATPFPQSSTTSTASRATTTDR